MKNLKALMMLLIGVFALTVTSCNTDDGDHYYTQEEQDAIQAKMVGTYSGSLYMYKPNTSTKKYEVYHSLPTTWTASKGNPALGKDSLITISNFPINKLDSAIVISEKDNSDEAKTLRALRTASCLPRTSSASSSCQATTLTTHSTTDTASSSIR